MLGNIEFRAVQARNNKNFTCEETDLSPTPTPSPTLACAQADVMLVLDRSGSINPTELSQLKTAAKAFIDALGLSTFGIHAGFSSFATNGTLNQHLTDDSLTVKSAIDALVSGGFTNLKEGLDLARNEHANPGDGHDRDDSTSPDKVIVITDGHPNRPLPSDTADDAAASSADAYWADGAEIFVVGVGSDVNTTYLKNEIADPDDPGEQHYYSITDYSGLENLLKNLDLCQ